MPTFGRLCDQAGMRKICKRPPGSDWKTVAEVAKEEGWTIPQARKRLQELHRLGAVESMLANVGTAIARMYRARPRVS